MSRDRSLSEFTETSHFEDREETSLGYLPSDWTIEELDAVCRVNPDGFSEEDWDSDTFEYISLSDVSDGEILQSNTTPVEEAPSRAQRRIREGDMLVGTVRPPQRSHGFVTKNHDGKVCSSGFGVLRSQSNLNSLYLLQEVLSHRFFRQMEAYVAGSGYPAVKLSDLKKHKVAIPPLDEQRKIATVLYNVDQAIQKTDEIIEQTKRTKAGVAQDLIRNGVETAETKKAWMGEIPAHWNVEEFSSIIELSQNGVYIESEDYGGDYPIIKMGDIFKGTFLEQPIAEQVHLTDEEVDKYGTQKGDLVFARHAQAGWGAGDCTYIPELDKTAVVESNMVHVRLGSRANPLFYAQYFNSEIGVKSMKRITKQGNIKSISQGDLQNLKIPIPPLDEQEQIGEALTEFDRTIANAERESTCLKTLKQGLMQDLLSGEVRTHDKDIEVLDEVKQYG